MPWSRKLAKSIALRDGRTIVTLGDVRALVLSLPAAHRHTAQWRLIAELLKEDAANFAFVSDLAIEARLALALKAEGLL
jgi:hypothetical protein